MKGNDPGGLRSGRSVRVPEAIRSMSRAQERARGSLPGMNVGQVPKRAAIHFDPKSWIER